MIKRIGFFDSGMGGLSVLREAVRLMPEEHYIYYGDTANAPYGGKTEEEIYSLAMNAVSYLVSNDIKALVIACNTATGVAVDRIRHEIDIPVISMEPAVKPAFEQTDGKILVMATPATLRQDRYARLVEHIGAGDRVINLPCENLAGLIENSRDGKDVAVYLAELLAPYGNCGVTACVLGCTHYIFVKDIIKACLPEGVKLFDGNAGTVAHLKDVLEQNGIKESGTQKGTIILNSSSDDQYTMKTYAKLLYTN